MPAPLRSIHDFDASDPAFQADPYPVYAFMRERAPVHAHAGMQGDALVSCFRYDDVVEVLRSPQNETTNIGDEVIDGRSLIDALLQQPDSPLHCLARIVSSVMLVKDGEDHRRLRGLVSQAFTPRRVEALRPRVEEIVDALLTEIAPRGETDLIHDFAAPLPVVVIAELLGMPPEDREQLRRWSDGLAAFIDGTIRQASIPAAARAADELCAYMERIIEERRAAPRDDLISALVAARDAGDRLGANELLGTVGLVLAAGHETTTHLIGNGVLALLRHPDQLAKLRREPEHAESAVEELLRFDSPVQTTSRRPVRDGSLRGVPYRAGQELGVYLGAANRDPEVFPDPDVLDITRSGARHVAFGHGAHFCLGAALARLEGQVAIRALVERLPSLKLAGEDLPRRSGIVLRGLIRLPLRF